MDPITVRFQSIRWAAILTGIGLPALAWIVAAVALNLPRTTAIQVTLAAILLSIGVLKLVSNYLQDGFVRSYMDSDNWDYLLARFGVAKMPAEWVRAPGVAGLGQLDRDDVVFAMSTAASTTGLFVNLMPFGRLVLPWSAVQMLKRKQLMMENGPQDSVSLILDGPDCALSVPWDSALDDKVPASVGIGQGGIS